MKTLRFDVFGREVVVSSTTDGWEAVFVSRDGKSRPAGFSIPADLHEDEIIVYLDDLFHESASVENSSVKRV